MSHIGHSVEDARKRAGVPRASKCSEEMKAWMAGTGPAMTNDHIGVFPPDALPWMLPKGSVHVLE